MLIVPSRNHVPIRLTEERWRHIAERHPEMADKHEMVLEALAEPDEVQQGDFGELLAIRAYPGLDLGKFIVVVYRENAPDDGFVLTAYVTSRPSARRKVLWKP
jgi:hypothetical protein